MRELAHQCSRKLRALSIAPRLPNVSDAGSRRPLLPVRIGLWSFDQADSRTGRKGRGTCRTYVEISPVGPVQPRPSLGATGVAVASRRRPLARGALLPDSESPASMHFSARRNLVQSLSCPTPGSSCSRWSLCLSPPPQIGKAGLLVDPSRSVLVVKPHCREAFGAADQDRFSWPCLIGLLHRTERPSDSPVAVPSACGTVPASGYRPCADVA